MVSYNVPKSAGEGGQVVFPQKSHNLKITEKYEYMFEKLLKKHREYDSIYTEQMFLSKIRKQKELLWGLKSIE